MARTALLICLLALLLAPGARAAGPVATKRALAREMRAAGAASGALVVDLDTGAQLFARRPDVRRMPASVEKLYTSVAALRRLGPGARLRTFVLAARPPDPLGVVPGDLYLRGGGDPYLSSTDLERLAGRVAEAGVTGVGGRVVGDESAFDARRGPPSSGFRLDFDTGPLSALAVNHGRSGRRSPYFQPRPASFAAAAFTRALRRAGIAVAGRPGPGVTVATAVPLAERRSRPLGELLGLMNGPSDNFMAETLIKGLGARPGVPGSTGAGARVVRAELAELGISPQVIDGSGLSRLDRTSPREVVTMLAATAADPVLERSLAVAGRSGTLAFRMRGSAAQDRCRAKTGTLRDVSALAGYCTTTSGSRVAFAFLMNRTVPWWARRVQDRMTAVLARYTGVGATSTATRVTSSWGGTTSGSVR